MTTPFDRAQSAYDSMEPPDIHEHAPDWGSMDIGEWFNDVEGNVIEVNCTDPLCSEVWESFFDRDRAEWNSRGKRL